TPRRSISRSRSSMKRWHSLRSSSRSLAGMMLSSTKKPSSRKLRACSDGMRGTETATVLSPWSLTHHRICDKSPRVFARVGDFLSFLVMIDDLGPRDGFEGRVVRHLAGDARANAHRHAELEVNLVVRGTASYLLGERRYDLARGTLTWLFPGQDHVLVDESGDHELWWAVFRPSLVARIATTQQARPLLEADPVGQFSR